MGHKRESLLDRVYVPGETGSCRINSAESLSQAAPPGSPMALIRRGSKRPARSYGGICVRICNGVTDMHPCPIAMFTASPVYQ